MNTKFLVNEQGKRELYAAVYSWLYDNDNDFSIIIPLMQLGEVVTKQRPLLAKDFMINVAEDAVVSDREIAAMFAVMWTYSDYCQELAESVGVSGIVENLIKNGNKMIEK